VEWRGSGQLTWTNENGSNLDISKIVEPYEAGGVSQKATVINPALLTLVGLEPNTEVRVYESGTTTELAGIENSGTSFSATVGVPAVDIVLMSLEFVYQKIENIDTSSSTTVPVQQFFDRNYENP